MTRSIEDERAAVTLGIPGIFSVYNALGVIAAALALHIPLAEIADALRTAQSVKGRVEVVPTPGKDYTVLIDYSHTPDSLENILKSRARLLHGPHHRRLRLRRRPRPFQASRHGQNRGRAV
ncbi:MAG: hypothetical protein ACLS3C_05275 [Oscillospiraceae bacterium]